MTPDLESVLLHMRVLYDVRRILHVFSISMTPDLESVLLHVSSYYYACSLSPISSWTPGTPCIESGRLMLMSGGGKVTRQSRPCTGPSCRPDVGPFGGVLGGVLVSASRSPRFQSGHLSHGPQAVEADQAGEVRRGRKEGGESGGEDKSSRLTSGNARAREQSRPVTARAGILKTTGI
jgi:hypothetical protein